MNQPLDIERMHQPAASGFGGYRLLEPRQKYNLAFCTEEEIEIAEHFRSFVDRELMPYRHEQTTCLKGNLFIGFHIF